MPFARFRSRSLARARSARPKWVFLLRRYQPALCISSCPPFPTSSALAAPDPTRLPPRALDCARDRGGSYGDSGIDPLLASAFVRRPRWCAGCSQAARSALCNSAEATTGPSPSYAVTGVMLPRSSRIGAIRCPPSLGQRAQRDVRVREVRCSSICSNLRNAPMHWPQAAWTYASATWPKGCGSRLSSKVLTPRRHPRGAQLDCLEAGDRQPIRTQVSGARWLKASLLFNWESNVRGSSALGPPLDRINSHPNPSCGPGCRGLKRKITQ